MTRPVQCIDEQALGEALALPPSDPQRAHLDSCPRCQALVVSYREFLEPSREEAHGYGTEEDERLTAYRARMFGTPAPAGAARNPLREVDATQDPSWWSKLFAPAMRPIWGLGALLIAFGVMRLSTHPEPGIEPPTLRGAATHQIVPAAPSYLPDGGVSLAWPAYTGANRYELRFYSTALTEVGRRDAGSDTLVNLALADLPEAYRNGEAVLYRIVAIRDGDDLEASPPTSLKKP